MAILLYVTITLACTVYVHAQSKYCCTPQQWESVNMLIDGRDTAGNATKPLLTQGYEQVSVDGVNHKIASLSTLTTSSGFNITVQVIQLYDKGIMYTVEDGECKHSALPAWTPRCVPDDAKLLTKYSLGQGSVHVDVDVYSVTVGPNTVFLNIASADCTPIYQTAYGSAAGVSALSMKTYSNFTLGIKDPIVFNVPSICNNATYLQKLPHLHPLH
ncbi:uncharacterized protein LOC128225250 [Mya arenaria]|uniref:uncharacterized protein LOC128225250 n=1 Tax=Mya arenaria TaxID=6604 RepID=UPI0022E86E61|nr:uncharacterized protein LOC128225250 [Mya arenaria]